MGKFVGHTIRWLFHAKADLALDSWCVCVCVCRSDGPRRAAVVNYFADGVKSNTDESLLNGVPQVKKVNEQSLKYNYNNTTNLIVYPCATQ